MTSLQMENFWFEQLQIHCPTGAHHTHGSIKCMEFTPVPRFRELSEFVIAMPDPISQPAVN